MRKSISVSLGFSLVALALAYLLAAPVARFVTVVGLGRAARQFPPNATVIAIPDTIHCEDIHYHAPSNKIFTACEDDASTRFAWFPPLAHMDHEKLSLRTTGSVHVIDPETKLSTRLRFLNFPHPFITHGIDVLSDPTRAPDKAVYIFAVNHLPNPDYTINGTEPRARSQIELFHHVLGSGILRHVRSVRHPLIKTPNDVVGLSPTEFYVTNDHYHRDGLMRMVEDMWWGARWTDVVNVRITDLKARGDAGIKASVAVDGLHNANGLGKGRTQSELLVAQAVSGVLHIGQLDDKVQTAAGSTNLRMKESLYLDSTVDNPSYFHDPWATPLSDKSGIILPGLSQGIKIRQTIGNQTATEAVVVWFIQDNKQGTGTENGTTWEKRILFEDDGTRIRSASAAVLVGIDPKKEGGERRAWLYVTGFLSMSVVAVKVDL